MAKFTTENGATIEVSREDPDLVHVKIDRPGVAATSIKVPTGTLEVLLDDADAEFDAEVEGP